MFKHVYAVYILANQRHTVLYIGVTSNLLKRIYQHKNKKYQGFTAKYNVDQLLYYEYFEIVTEAIKREKELKGWRREKKEALINSINPKWDDLYGELSL